MEKVEIKSFKKRLAINPNLKQEVIDYYLKTNSIQKTRITFKTSFLQIVNLLTEAGVYKKSTIKTIYDKIKENPQLKEEIISYYLLPSSMNDTVKKFNLGSRQVLKRFLIKFNVPLHTEEIKKQLCIINAETTIYKKYGVSNPWCSPAIREKCCNSLEKTTGFRNPGKVVEFREKARQTNLEKYGIENPFQAEIFKEKSKKTCQERYGTNYYTQCNESKQRHNEYWQNLSQEAKNNIQEKVEATMIERYGVRRYAQTIEFHVQSQHKYIYKDELFDSLPELALWIYAKDHYIEIVREPCKISYEFEGTTHYYFPDFLYDGKLLEIKGDQFFDDSTGKMICPFCREQDDLFEAKHQCMIKNNIIIWRPKQYQFAIDYFNSKYIKEDFEYFKDKFKNKVENIA